MSQLDPSQINVILATDCGSTTTKAILIEKVDGHYRQTFRGEAPTTVEEPVADVTVGVINAATEVGELAGRKLVDENGNIVRPATATEGCDIYISTSSAGGGLQVLVTGVVREMSAASAERAALGAGAIVLDLIASNDKRRAHEQIQRIRELRPRYGGDGRWNRWGNREACCANCRTDCSGETKAPIRQQLSDACDLRGEL